MFAVRISVLVPGLLGPLAAILSGGTEVSAQSRPHALPEAESAYVVVGPERGNTGISLVRPGGFPVFASRAEVPSRLSRLQPGGSAVNPHGIARTGELPVAGNALAEGRGRALDETAASRVPELKLPKIGSETEEGRSRVPRLWIPEFDVADTGPWKSGGLMVVFARGPESDREDNLSTHGEPEAVGEPSAKTEGKTEARLSEIETTLDRVREALGGVPTPEATGDRPEAAGSETVPAKPADHGRLASRDLPASGLGPGRPYPLFNDSPYGPGDVVLAGPRPYLPATGGGMVVVTEKRRAAPVFSEPPSFESFLEKLREREDEEGSPEEEEARARDEDRFAEAEDSGGRDVRQTEEPVTRPEARGDTRREGQARDRGIFVRPGETESFRDRVFLYFPHPDESFRSPRIVVTPDDASFFTAPEVALPRGRATYRQVP